MPNTALENQHDRADSDRKRQLAVLKHKLLEEQNIRQALQNSEKRYRRLFESARDGILNFNAGRKRLLAAFAQMTGYNFSGSQSFGTDCQLCGRQTQRSS